MGAVGRLPGAASQAASMSQSAAFKAWRSEQVNNSCSAAASSSLEGVDGDEDSVSGGSRNKPSPIAQEVKEAMYQHRWDKLLVDCRRYVTLKPGYGRQEHYTAMVAVGNMR
ncbi:S5 DRBM domain-containing protein, partial [Haematococcus lacustris]